MLKINCFLYAVRVQDCKQREAYLSMWESRKQPYLPLIKSTKTQYKEGGRRIRPARYTCRAINTTYSANPSVLEIIELAITIRGKTPRNHCLIVSTKKIIFWESWLFITTLCLLYFCRDFLFGFERVRGFLWGIFSITNHLPCRSGGSSGFVF